MYKQAIIVFGMVIPGGVMLLTLIVMWVMLGKFETEHEARVAAFELSKVNKVKEKGLETKLSSRRGRMSYWEDYLSGDVIRMLDGNLEAIRERFDSNQLRMAAASRPPRESKLGAGVDAQSSQFRLTFEGGYGPMQEMFAELELLMPQLLLEQLEISPGKKAQEGEDRSLVFQISYTAWSK